MEAFVNDTVTIRVDCGIGVSGYSGLFLKYKKPDDSVGLWVATINPTNDHCIEYTTISGDFDISGLWKIQSYITEGTDKLTGRWDYIKVFNPLFLTTSIATTDVPVTVLPDLAGPLYYLSNFSTIAAAASYLNSLNTLCGLIINRDETLLSNISFDPDVVIYPTPGNVLTLSTFNLTIGRLNQTALYQWVNKNSTGNLKFAEGAVEWVSPHWWSGALSGSDITVGLQGAFDSMPGAHIRLAIGVFEWSSKITNTALGNRGGYILKGAGCALHLSAATTTGKGTTLRWTGLSTATGFDLGQGPTYIDGVYQSFDDYQFGNKLTDFSVVYETGIARTIYIHDQDNTVIQNVYFDAFSRNDVRGVIDARGTINNVKLDQIIFANIINGYCIRAGDGATNWQCNQVFVENCALGYWIGDVVAYQDPYQNGMISITDGTFEGLSGAGKFIVTTLNGGISSGVTALTVTDSTGMVVGDPIFLDRGNSKFEMNRITNINGNNLTLAYNTEYTHLTGVIVIIGEIGVYCGYSSISSGRTTGIRLVRPMFDKIGCGIFAHDVECIDVYMPTFITSMVRGLYIDGSVQNLNLVNPRVLDGMPADWRLFEITDRGGTYNFNWLGGADKSGVSEPYINSQGELDSFFIGSFAQTGGDSSFPQYFRGVTFDGTDGIILRESEGAVGLKYRTGAAPGNDNFTVTPAGLGVFASGIELPGGNIWMEDTAEPSAPATGGILFVERWDTPAKGHLYIKFPTGAKQLLATEP